MSHCKPPHYINIQKFTFIFLSFLYIKAPSNPGVSRIKRKKKVFWWQAETNVLIFFICVVVCLFNLACIFNLLLSFGFCLFLFSLLLFHAFHTFLYWLLMCFELVSVNWSECTLHGILSNSFNASPKYHSFSSN